MPCEPGYCEVCWRMYIHTGIYTLTRTHTHTQVTSLLFSVYFDSLDLRQTSQAPEPRVGTPNSRHIYLTELLCKQRNSYSIQNESQYLKKRTNL